MLLHVGVLALVLVGGAAAYLADAVGLFSRDSEGVSFLADEPVADLQVPGALSSSSELNRGGKDWKGWRSASFEALAAMPDEPSRREAHDRLVQEALVAGWSLEGEPDAPWDRETGTGPTSYRIDRFTRSMPGPSRTAHLAISESTAHAFGIRLAITT